MEDQPVLIQPERQAAVMSVEDLVMRMRYVQELKEKMEEGVHYGKIPGILKPSLWEPGAEVLCAGFQLYPKYEVVIDDLNNDHIRVRSKCRLFHKVTDRQEGEDDAVCTTKEKKYRYVQQQRTCPKCHKETIIIDKFTFGFYCFPKNGGCGAKFNEKDTSVTSQQLGQIENPDPADKWNTITQMSQKRAYVKATLVATAASEFFTQDDDSDQRPQEEEGQSKPKQQEEKKLVTQPKPEEKPFPREQPVALREIVGVIRSIVAGGKAVEVQIQERDQQNTVTFNHVCYFRLDKLPLGMPAQQVDGQWEYLKGKSCIAKCEQAKSSGGVDMLLLREIKVELEVSPAESKRKFEEMKAKYSNGLLDEKQKQTLRQAATMESLPDKDFDAFLVAIHQSKIDSLPAAKYAEVLDQLTCGFAAQWCFDHGPLAPDPRLTA